MNGWEVALVAVISALAGIFGAYFKAWVDRRAAAKLGLPTDTETKLINLREEYMKDLEREVQHRKESEDRCLGELAIERELRQDLEKHVDRLEIRISRLVNELAKIPGVVDE